MSAASARAIFGLTGLVCAACAGASSQLLPATTVGPATTPAPPATTAHAVTGAPTDPDVLAGGRVLCSYDGPSAPEALLNQLQDGKAAGVLLYGDNITNRIVARANADAVQAAAEAGPAAAPAIIATDQEGGKINRVPGPPTAPAADLGGQPLAAIRAQGRATGENLRTWGINVDLAPVADVARPGSFEVAQQRSFGDNAQQVSNDVSAFVSGLETGGVAATVKHFPGLGAAVENTDLRPAVVSLPASTLDSVDLAPFRAGVDAGAQLVMVASATYPALAAQPAVLAPELIHDVLRDKLGFTGVTVSDALDAPGITSVAPPGELAVRAAPAVDLFLAKYPATCTQFETSLAAAIRTGRLPLAAAQAAYERVLALRRGL